MSRFLAALSVLVLAILATACASVPALAHAQLLSASPAANAVLAAAPFEVELVFNEPVSPLAVSLLGPDGTSIDLTDATEGGDHVLVPMPADLGGGTMVLNWRVVSLDAHPIAGALVFSVGQVTDTGANPEETPLGLRVTAILLWASKALLFAGLCAGLGGAVFALVAPLPAEARPVVLGLCLLGLVAAPLSLGLHGADALGLAPDALLTPPAWQAAFATNYGPSVLALVLAFALAFLALQAWTPLVWLAWALGAAALALSGHAGAAAPQMLTRSAVAMHIAGILFWLGALLPLWFWLRRRDTAADAALVRFSRAIPFAVLAILVSGIVLAVVQLGAPSGAWLSPYGAILAAKLTCLAGLLGLALWNRLRLTAPSLAGHVAARHRLRQSIVTELALALAILALAAGWRFTPPPRALAEAAQQQALRNEPAYAHVMTDAFMVDIAATPGHAGMVDFEFWLFDGEGAPVEPLSLDVVLSAPDLGIEPIRASASPADGYWQLTGQLVPLPGTWTLELELRASRFSLVTLSTQIQIQP